MTSPEAKKPNHTSEEWEPDVIVYTDASVGEQGKTSIGFVMTTTNGEVIERGAQILDDEKSSNVAEYIAVLRAVSEAREMGYTDPVIRTDYKNIVDHVFGEAHPSDNTCTNIKDKLVGLLKEGFDRWMLEWIPREKNEMAHKTATQPAPTPA